MAGKSRLPEPALLANMVNEHGTAHVARSYRLTRDAVQARLRRAGYRAVKGTPYPFYRKETDDPSETDRAG